MISKFLFLFGQLNLLSFFFEKQVKVIEKSGFTMTEIIEIFKYKKNNNRYWDKAELY